MQAEEAIELVDFWQDVECLAGDGFAGRLFVPGGCGGVVVQVIENASAWG